MTAERTRRGRPLDRRIIGRRVLPSTKSLRSRNLDELVPGLVSYLASSTLARIGLPAGPQCLVGAKAAFLRKGLPWL
jgi:hypothetical protein